jgi:hypothetical protein
MTICAIGDSFVAGAELVETHFPEVFAGIADDQRDKITFSVPDQKEKHREYYSALDSLRFSSLLASNLKCKHYNFAQGAASQEGIKMQAYLLLDKLKKDAVDPSSTHWIVGVTSPWRQLILPEYSAFCVNKDLQNTEYGIEWVLSRSTGITLTPSYKHVHISKQFYKEWTSVFSNYSILMSWAMNITDTINLLRTNGIRHIILLNFFEGFRRLLMHLSSEDLREINVRVSDILKKNDVDLSSQGLDDVLNSKSMVQLLGLPGFNKAWRCPQGHFNKEGNQLIVDYLLGKYFNENCF